MNRRLFLASVFGAVAARALPAAPVSATAEYDKLWRETWELHSRIRQERTPIWTAALRLLDEVTMRAGGDYLKSCRWSVSQSYRAHVFMQGISLASWDAAKPVDGAVNPLKTGYSDFTWLGLPADIDPPFIPKDWAFLFAPEGEPLGAVSIDGRFVPSTFVPKRKWIMEINNTRGGNYRQYDI